ncbi:P2X purinoceptor 7-like [Bufo bufo]|uniref:P2X purinoceptor 7-like n=1 Tax=Bufo bufo TaxID=8384 RepID=UPI001ABE300F|nr:P2X purinoceptor 7-like [Bufo bufo]
MDSDSHQVSSSASTTRAEKLEWIKKCLQEKYGCPDNSEPCFPENPTRPSNSEDNVEIEESDYRLGNKLWCTCNNCEPMPMPVESICCQEVSNIEPYLEEMGCIIEHDYFHQFCQDRGKVEVSMRSIGQVLHPPPDKDLNRLLRKTAYRGFTSWIHGYLGVAKRRPIPSCAVSVIRKVFPDPEQDYCGFLMFREEPAEYLAME